MTARIDAIGNILNGRFSLTERLGTGTATTFRILTVDRTGRPLVVEVSPDDMRVQVSLVQEEPEAEWEGKVASGIAAMREEVIELLEATDIALQQEETITFE